MTVRVLGVFAGSMVMRIAEGGRGGGGGGGGGWEWLVFGSEIFTSRGTVWFMG